MLELAVSNPIARSLRSGSVLRRQIRLRRRMPAVIVLCFAWIIGLALAATFAPEIAPADPMKQNLRARNVPPVWLDGGSWDHPFGTDQIGYDIFSRTLYGARPALQIGALAAVIGLVTGTVLGIVAGYFRGIPDAVIMLLADAQLSTPFLVIAIAAVAAFGRGTLILIVLAGISGWMGFARTIRAQVLSLRMRDYVVASHAIGAGNLHILIRHLLPNLASIII